MKPGGVVAAPIAGRVVALAEVPDPVFSGGLIGSGVAIEPPADAGVIEVVAPCAGRVVRVMAHAAVVSLGDGLDAALVHLGTETVGLGVQVFTPLVSDGDDVAAGQALLRWDVARTVALGHSILSPVVVLQASPDRVTSVVRLGDVVGAGEPLLEITNLLDLIS